MRTILAMLAIILGLCADDAYIQMTGETTQIPTPLTGSLILSNSIGPLLNFIVTPNKDGVICQIPGTYLVFTGLQPATLSRGISGYLDTWFVQNGVPIISSNDRQYVDEHSRLTLITNATLISLNQGDVISTAFLSSRPNIGIKFIQSPLTSAPESISKPILPSVTSFVFSAFKIKESGAYAQLASAETQAPLPNTGSFILSEPNATLTLGNIVKNFSPPLNGVITCQIGGIYLISTGLQVSALNDKASGYLDSWYELNNKPITYSNSRGYVNQDSKTSLLVNTFLIRLKEGDQFGIKFLASGPDIGIINIAGLPYNEPNILSFGATLVKID